MVKRDYLSFVRRLFRFLCINLTKLGIMFLFCFVCFVLLTLLVEELVGLVVFFCKLPLSFVSFCCVSFAKAHCCVLHYCNFISRFQVLYVGSNEYERVRFAYRKSGLKKIIRTFPISPPPL